MDCSRSNTAARSAESGLLPFRNAARQFALDGDYVWVCDYDGTMLRSSRFIRWPDQSHGEDGFSRGRYGRFSPCPIDLGLGDSGHGPVGDSVSSGASASATPGAGSQPRVPPANDGRQDHGPAEEKHEAAPWEPDSLSIWTRDAKLGYVRRAKICTRFLDVATGHLGYDIAGILPLEAPFCLIISMQGAAYRLDLDKGTLLPLALQVTPAPPAPVGSKHELGQQMAVYMSWLSQVPRSESDAISESTCGKPIPP